MKYVRNACYGGFGLSEYAVRLFNMYAETTYENGYDIKDQVPRNDPNLVKVVENMGKAVNTDTSNLIIVEIPNDVEPILEEYDGWERFEEPHRTW